MSVQLEEKDSLGRFSLTSTEGQKHLKALNDELKALNEQGSSKLSVVHATQVEQFQKSSSKKRRLMVNSSRNSSQSNREKSIRKHLKNSPLKRKSLNERKVLSIKSVEKNEETATEIDSVLEEKAGKAKLTAINVKNILKYVVTNEQVLAMVDRRAKSTDNNFEEKTEFEPKLTRSKAKELLQKEAPVTLPWTISPIKNSSPSKKLMELMEISEPDSSSDEEYQPDVLKNTFTSIENDESAHSILASDDDFQQDASSLENPFASTDNEESAQSLPSYDPNATQSEAQIDDNLETEESAIALRTRSKLPLNDTPLETIEASFIAPDITVDMYYEEYDDEEWNAFLGEFKKPLDCVVDDDANDPEYNFLEEEDVPDVEDLRDDRAVRIPKKELHELMAELLESAEDYTDYPETEDDYFHPESPNSLTSSAPTKSNVVHNADLKKPQSCSATEELFNYERRQLLEEQMRKHVQLLLQMYLLASDNQQTFFHLQEQCRLLLDELHKFSEKHRQTYGQSSFLSCNLMEALPIVRAFSCGSPRSRGFQKRSSSNKLVVSDRVLSTILHSDVFIYPELLPTRGLKPISPFKSNFTEAEDNLLALGLEQFTNIEGFSCWALIREHMIPIKTSKQICNRVKNLKNSSKSPNNPVKCFYRHNRSPMFVHSVEQFQANSVCPLVKRNPKLLPGIFQTYLSENRRSIAMPSKKLLPAKPTLQLPVPPKIGEKRGKKQYVTTPLYKLNQLPTKPEAADKDVLEMNAVKQCEPKTPEKNTDGKHFAHTSMPILSFSPTFKLTPLKQVSPILKKYKPNTLRKTGGNMTNVRKHLPTLFPKYVVVRQNAPRKLAPKATPSISSNDITKTTLIDATTASLIEVTKTSSIEVAETPMIELITAHLSEATKTSQIDEKKATPIEISEAPLRNEPMIGALSNDNVENIDENNIKVKENEADIQGDVSFPLKNAALDAEKTSVQLLPPSLVLFEKEVEVNNVANDGNDSRKDSQAMDFRDSGSEAEIFDDGDDTVDDEAHADNEDDLAALMEASTTIKVIPRQKQQNVIKRKKQKSDRKATMAMLSCEAFEIEMSEEKENAFADAYLQRVKEVVGVNKTFEEFLKTLHDFNGSNKSVVELYKDVCRIFKDYPDLCDEFVAFLLPAQAVACGKSMEYINLTRLQVFLKKLEVHFEKHPHHIQKLLKVLSQIQLSKNLSIEELKKAVFPLLRSQQHLIEEFLQLFPEESVTESRMTNFEEVYIPNVEEDLVPDDKEYETIIHFPEQNDIYGSPDCPCTCHSGDKTKTQNRLKHCFECGIKFFDGRIFLQTGKVLKPCQVIYPNSTLASVAHTELACDNSKQNLSTSIISPSSSLSSLSPLIQTDSDDKGQNVVQDVTTQKTSTAEGHITVHSSSISHDSSLEESMLITNHLMNSTTNLVSGEYRRVLAAQSDSCHGKPMKSKFKASLSDEVVQSESRNHGNKWTRECDRVLLQTCQKLKASKETFAVIAHQLENRSADDVEKRFHFLMSLFSGKKTGNENCDKTTSQLE